jgi:ketosteroid isomerase-like protein
MKPYVLNAILIAAGLMAGAAQGTPDDDRKQVARLDAEFQAAVKINDAQTMDRILHKDMVLVLGDGRINTRDELLQESRDKVVHYERQDEEPGTQTVRIWGDTAVVTALLWVKGSSKGAEFDLRLWFSDIYVRSNEGWRYVFGQASLHLPEATRRP